MRGLVKDIKEIKAYLQDNMKAGMCRNELIKLVLKEGAGE